MVWKSERVLFGKSNMSDPHETLASLPSGADMSRLAFTQFSNMGATEYLKHVFSKIGSSESMEKILANAEETGEAIKALMVGAKFLNELSATMTLNEGTTDPTTEQYQQELDAILQELSGWQAKLREVCVAAETLLAVGSGIQPRTPEDLQVEIDALTAVFANRFKVQLNESIVNSLTE